MSPDSWSYWEGAVSLAAGQGYTYFSGARIVDWPPLYSLYLAAWSMPFGPTARALIFANATLVAAQAAVWCWSLLTIWQESCREQPHASAVGTTVIYLGLFVPLWQQTVLADVLKYTVLPLLLLASWKAHRSSSPADLARWAAASIVAATALLLTHNDSVAFVLAGSLALLCSEGKWTQRMIASAMMTFVPVAIWSLARHALQQDRSHLFGLGRGRFGAATYLNQLLLGAGSLIVPDRGGAPWVVVAIMIVLIGVLLRRRVGSAALIFCGAFVAISALITFALFNLTWVSDALGDRFLLFVPLALVPLLLLASTPWSRAAFIACALVALTPQLYWTLAWMNIRTRLPLSSMGYPGGFVTPRAMLSVGYRSGPPVEKDGAALLAPQR